MGDKGFAPSANVDQTRDNISKWRREHPRGPLPTELWASAIVVADGMGVYEAARALGVSYGALMARVKNGNGSKGSRGRTRRAAGRADSRRHVDARGTKALVVPASKTESFVEVCGAPFLGASMTTTVVEVTGGDGVRATVRLGERDRINLPEVLDALLRRRP